MVPESRALLPDDDDVDLVEKAKARRKKRLEEELDAEQQFVRAERLKTTDNKKLESSVQNAVYNLAKSGSKLEAGSLGEVSDLLKASWVREFDSAASELSSRVLGAPDGAKEVLTGIKTLQSIAEKGDVTESKKLYVEVVSSFQSWTSKVGLRSLKGL